MFKHGDHRHETVAQARECEANTKATRGHFEPLPKPAKAPEVWPWADGTRPGASEDVAGWYTEASDRLTRSHAASTILASMRRDAEKPANLATEKQVNYVLGLLGERDTSGLEEWASRMRTEADAGRMTKNTAHSAIDTLKGLPKKPAGDYANPKAKRNNEWRTLAEQVPDGNYGLPSGPGQDKPHFYRVARTARGYFKLQERASDQLWEVPLKNFVEILTAIIDFGVDASGMYFATETSRCRRCYATLTDHDNPYFGVGLGPDCGAKG